MKPKRNEFEFKEIIQETTKARQFVMNGGNVIWLAKSCCTIRDKYVKIPKWLQEEIMNGAAKKFERDMKQLKLELV